MCRHPAQHNLKMTTKELLVKISDAKLGDLRKIAREIKINHDLAMKLWSGGDLRARLLAILIMDKKLFDADSVEKAFRDIEEHDYVDRLQLADWLMANQLAGDKKLTSLILTWKDHSSSLLRRIFWYHQARQRWVGQKPPGNTAELLDSIEADISAEKPEVQWAMNFTAAWIGIFEKSFRSRCIQIGEKSGLYKDEIVAKNCTPSYLPAFIPAEVKKRNLQ